MKNEEREQGVKTRCPLWSRAEQHDECQTLYVGSGMLDSPHAQILMYTHAHKASRIAKKERRKEARGC